MKFKSLTEAEKQEYFDRHLPHRLVLLRTFRQRFMDAAHHDTKDGDVYRCAKDANLLAIRFWTDLFGLRGIYRESRYLLEDNMDRSRPDDVKVYSFLPSHQLEVDSIADGTYIAHAYVIADKELAHLTGSFQRRPNDINLLRRATYAVEELIRTRLYEPCNRRLPEHREGSSW